MAIRRHLRYADPAYNQHLSQQHKKVAGEEPQNELFTSFLHQRQPDHKTNCNLGEELFSFSYQVHS
ncbi:hypothetical protein J6590_095020 [Homalodisca vitripennis]|nr:hypothetical protein J6590_095020 [Homalodisca vitripennis]